ncbi:Biotin synthase [Planctomycetes bacterium CA13]|uniref:Biotin synthase n=1 Tax=Novipirellula herctigrandis TaxID=2527986 RepID=A0A5C5YXV1_9BACT|nr:Biotin synthase [Planctomycetes bacterium CA13]
MSISTDSSATLTEPELSPELPMSRYDQLADQVLDGQPVSREEALAILDAPDTHVPAILAAGFKIRNRYFGRTVQMNFLMSAKSGLCPEDCSYCSQSKVSEAPVPKHNILKRDDLMKAAAQASEQGAKTYCLVISARGPSEREMKAVEEIVPEIKQKYDLDICACLGLLNKEQADRLKECGVNRVNHNLNTSETHYAEVCTTHTYADRVQTLKHVKAAGMEMCSGGIIGMDEKSDDIVSMAMDLRELGVHSIPLNFLESIDGTPFQGKSNLTPNKCLKALAMFRFVIPDKELRISGGREIHLRSLQPLGLYVANSMFVGDYLTTKGQAPDADRQMIEDLGFEITTKVE